MPKSVILTLAYGMTAYSTQRLRVAWDTGKDFRMSTTGQYCSIRDLEYLKADYDNIVIRASNYERTAQFECCIWNHPLAGLTTYI